MPLTPLEDQLEPSSALTPAGDLTAWFLASIAVSLKRIADQLEKDFG